MKRTTLSVWVACGLLLLIAWSSARAVAAEPPPAERLRAALARAEAHDAAAVPVLIDLLAQLSAEQRRPVEELLTRLAGEWAPAGVQGEDEIARQIRRDAWAAWWRHTDGPALLAALRKRTLTAEARARVSALIRRLGGEDFSVRERASADLCALGRLALPQLREAVADRDLEIARRARACIQQIEREPAHHLPLAAVRLLALRKPDGAVASLLDYLPYAEDDAHTEEVRKSLATLARREGKPAPALLAGLADPRPLVRSAAGEALARGGGADARPAVRKLFRDTDPEVRLRAGLAVAYAREREAVPVLIDLLTELPSERLEEIQNVLYQLAGDRPPEVPSGDGKEERKKCRDAWAAWWKTNADRVDLARLNAHSWLGYTLLCDIAAHRVCEVDHQGKTRWTIDNVQTPIDAVVLPGQRVLIAEYGANRVTERDFQGKVLWEKRIPRPVNVQRLPNGHTFIATYVGSILEVDRDGKEIYTINNVPGNVMAARRSRKGDIVCLTRVGQCLVLDTSGKQLAHFGAGGGLARNLGGLDLLPNDHVLVAQRGGNKVVEFDRDGKAVRELNVLGVQTASPLPNGHILVVGQNGQRVYEVDRAGKTVWEHKGAGQFFRARRR